jgi:hypothetical protein
MEVQLKAPSTHYAAKKPGEDKNSHFRRILVKVGRNELCPCGSGIKFKSCHKTEAALIALSRERYEQAVRAKEMANSI